MANEIKLAWKMGYVEAIIAHVLIHEDIAWQWAKDAWRENSKYVHHSMIRKFSTATKEWNEKRIAHREGLN